MSIIHRRSNTNRHGRHRREPGQVRMSLLYEAGSATGAVIDGQRFRANASKAYQAQMVMTGA